jgi:proline iminopeptidase
VTAVEAIVEVDGARLWTTTSGAGPIPLALVHGGPGLCDNLAPLAEMVEDLATVHRYDQRGGGRSSSEPPFTVRRFIDDVDALRWHWSHARWMALGHSWGGWLAMLVALEHPKRVTGVVVIGTAPFEPSWRPGYRAERATRLSTEERTFMDDVEARRESGRHLSDEDERRWTHLLWRTEFADPGSAPNFDDAPLYTCTANLKANRALVENLDRLVEARDLRTELASLGCPVLLIHGARDPRPPATEIVEARPGSTTIVEIADAGHLPWLERPDGVREALRAFVRRVAGLATEPPA